MQPGRVSTIPWGASTALLDSIVHVCSSVPIARWYARLTPAIVKMTPLVASADLYQRGQLAATGLARLCTCGGQDGPS